MYEFTPFKKTDKLSFESFMKFPRELLANKEYKNLSPNANKQKEFRQKNIDYFNHTDEKMQRIITDIDNAIKSAKKYSDFKLILKSKGYENIKDSGKYIIYISLEYYLLKISIKNSLQIIINKNEKII